MVKVNAASPPYLASSSESSIHLALAINARLDRFRLRGAMAITNVAGHGWRFFGKKLGRRTSPAALAQAYAKHEIFGLKIN